MASFSRFLDTIASIASGVKRIVGGGDTCYFVLEGEGVKVQFPVNPAEFEVERAYKNSVLNVNALGDINMKGTRGLKRLKFSSFFPANSYAWLDAGASAGNLFGSTSSVDPYGNVAKIERMADGKKPAKITISGTDVSMYCLVDEFTTKEQDGSGDVYFALTLSEYRHIGTVSEKADAVTGLKTRIAETQDTRKTTVAVGMSTMDAAVRAVSRTATTAKQAERRLKVYRTIAKSGGIPPGTIIETTAAGIRAGGMQIKF